MGEYGNTSSASLPLTIVTQLKSKMRSEKVRILAVAFGVGLAWGSAYFETNGIVCPEIILI
jgi:3-oxoacyl-[acyl-carrier-protein] synthase-3